MPTKDQYKIGDEDKVELYEEFFKAMLDFDYTPAFIGDEMAYIARAIEHAENSEE